MKLMIIWLRKDGMCRTWTNAEPHEHACMALTTYTDSTKRLSKIWKCSTQEVVGRINRMLNKKKNQTNADRIRSMTDEELAEYIAGICTYGFGKERFLKYLKSPAESEK
ncbi:hypothetical protein H8S37_04210 [Mediterraneibacter sp. NSJ-55]|uniref:Uncharacterized protein n=1 Tax=Mediterraneibacter hominis TaxID=2763054 RepID=A0A923LHB2_9FIRM|nr:hypothetical protein [Mediterraneibacter hominis]MBC5688137.1 hypothetical protein [Mediterraneibacter hominis]